ncbi:hypothetical protein H4R23_004683 [Coemansia sp. Cherry 401B]|nr:hypothetical protein H4R23_004683 [Coemansia sp. Cherry 401B]
MVPDEKKPIPWGLPPLRSEVLARQAQAAAVPEDREKEAELPEYFPEPSAHYASNGYMPLDRLEALSGRQRLGIFVGGALLLGGTALLASVGGCLMSAQGGGEPCPMHVVAELVRGGHNASNTVAWDRLAEMTDLYGHRMTASRAYDLSAEWVVRTANNDPNLTAYTEPVWVDEWVRGSESLELLVPTREGGRVPLQLLGLGSSAPTPAGGIEANVVPVHSFDELARLGNATISGSVVLFNFPYTGYGQVARFRSRGAVEAAKYGARAVLVRTLAPDSSFHSVHTGSSVRAAIPGAAISPADANMIERMYRRAQAGASPDHVFPRVRLSMDSRLREHARQSANVIIDLKGAELPDEIVLLSGHFDSWDVGVGAMDDGAGAFLGWEAARMIAAAGVAPRRTIRVVMWNNEETRQRGAHAYFDRHRDEIKRHRLAVESDIGVFEPWGLVVAAEDSVVERMRAFGANALRALGGGNVTATDREAPGEDIAVLCKHGVPCAGFLSVNPETGAAPGDPHWEDHYFRYHHASSDRVEAIDKHQLRRSAAALAAWAYMAAEY